MEAKEELLRNNDLFDYYLETIDLPYIRDDWQIDISKEKLALIDAPLYLRETVDRRGRGVSKTFDTMEIAEFLSAIGYRGIWFASGRDQLEQPKIYMKYIINHSRFLQRRIKNLLIESVEFTSGGTLKLKNLTELNARSGRADFIVYDEEAQADSAAYNAAVSILVGSDLGFVFHISTPAKATIFEENYERIRIREKKSGLKLTFRVIWDQASWLKARSGWYEEQKRIQPGWYFRQEHEASFELPSGAVFQNVLYDKYPEWLTTQIQHESLLSGIDWNPVNGHWLSSVKFTPDMKNIVIMEETPLGKGYTHELSNEMYNLIKPYYMRGNKLVVEDGGINEAYVKWLKEKEAENSMIGERNLKYEEWDSSGVNKLNAVQYITQHGITIWVDEDRFSIVAKEIRDCHWDTEATEPKLHKDPADSPHSLDAFLHAISKKNRMDNIIEMGVFY